MDQDRTAVKANPVPAVFIAEALDLCLAKKYLVAEELKEDFRRLALDAIDDEVELPARLALGLCLGRLGDTRIVILRDPEGYVEVCAGPYLYGEERDSRDRRAVPDRPLSGDQWPVRRVHRGYRDRQWWSEVGWAWLQAAEEVAEPEYWRDRRWNAPNQPVVGVSFWEAEACCAWAGGRLPTEQEWEASARGPRGLAYPWGNDREDGICNTFEAGLGVTSPVGLFPRSPQADVGIEDLAGNVWEWCGSLYDPSDANDTTRVAARRVLELQSGLRALGPPPQRELPDQPGLHHRLPRGVFVAHQRTLIAGAAATKSAGLKWAAGCVYPVGQNKKDYECPDETCVDA